MSESQERDVTEQVQRRAYELWEQAGRPEGRDEEFWHRASAEIAGGDANDAPTPLLAEIIR